MRPSFAVLVIASSLVSACADDGPTDEPVDCAKETSDDELLIGFSKPGDSGLYTFTITGLTPSPPTRMLNVWTMSIMSTGSPAAPLAATETIAVTPYMPEHGHGAGIDVEIAPMPTAGEFEFSSINLHMPGIWDVTIEVDPGEASYDKVVFKPCIPE